MEEQRLNILLVEDDEDDYTIFRDVLADIRTMRFDLDWVQTFNDALARGTCRQYDLYILDYRLGARNGLELLHEFQKSGCRSPIIILTGRGDYEIDLKAMREGAADYLEKSLINPLLLERTIRYAVERFKTLEELRWSNSRFQGVFLGAAIGIALTDTAGCLVETNPALEKMLGRGTDELQPLCLKDVLHPEDVEEVTAILHKSPDEPAGYDQVEARFRPFRGGEMVGRISVSKLTEGGQYGNYFIFMIEDITQRKQSEKALRKSARQLRVLSGKLLEAQEKERKVVAQELHDSIGSNLAAIKYGLEKKLHEMVQDQPPQRRTSLEDLIKMVQNTIEETRRIYSNLRPSILDDLGLISTLKWLSREFEELYSNIRVSCHLDIEEHEIAQPLKLVIYRISQEALNNIAKHSEATRVSVSLWKSGGQIQLVIKDDGKGFDYVRVLADERQTHGMGLASMKERAELSGGTFTIESKENTGTTLLTSWPAME